MMRVLVAALLLMPFAGCMGGGPAAADLFALRTLADEPTPRAVPGCDVLLDLLDRRALDEANANLRQSVENGWGHGGSIDIDFAMEDSVAMSSEAASGSGAPASFHAARSVTGTNNQEGSADEGDFVKTDGTWTYVLREGRLHVLVHMAIGSVDEVATIVFDQNGWGTGHLLLEPRDPDDPDDDRLVVVLPGAFPQDKSLSLISDSMQPRAQSGMTRIVVLDLADRSDPAIVSDTFIEGQATGVRLVDGVAHVVVQRQPSDLGLQYWAEADEPAVGLLRAILGMSPADEESAWRSAREAAAERAIAENRATVAGLTLRDHLPLVLSASDGEAPSPEPLGEEQCRHVLATPGPTGRAVSTIFSIAVADDLESSTTQVLGAGSIVYASGDALVLAAPSAEAWWVTSSAIAESTDLAWFDLDGLDVTARAAGRVAGSILDSFAIDVHDDRLRVATTINTWRWVADEPMSSQLVVLKPLGGILVPTGIVAGLAPTERIWSVRFTDDRAYVVTFRNMDPLWAIDLSTEVPVVLGELEIPGVSTYLHPLDKDTVLAIGYGAGEDGFGIDRGKVQVSLFDLSDPANPQRAAALDLPTDSSGNSLALDEHKAFTYWPEVGKLAVPLQSWGGEAPESVLQFVKVDRAGLDLELAGSIDQSMLAGDSWGGGIERSFFLGYPPFGPVSVYAVSGRGVTSHDLGTLQFEDSVAFPVTEQRYYID